ncbi:MAG: class I SAM-dependent methyltransferase [Candidatus Hodarchaeota archaeon]
MAEYTELGYETASQRRATKKKYLLANAYATGMVLDAGCGVGFGTDNLNSPAIERIIGIDINERYLLEAERTADGEISFVKMNVLQLAFKNETFDTVILYEMIEHVRQPKKLLENIHHILRPDGLLLLSTPNPVASLPRKKILKRSNPYHFHEYRVEEMKYLLNEYFRLIKVEGFFICRIDFPALAYLASVIERIMPLRLHSSIVYICRKR